MSAFVLTNLVVTAGMLTPNLSTFGILAWQVTNQSLNVAINASNANKSSPLSTQSLITSYAIAVSASCSVALGLNAIVPRLKRISPAVKATLGRLVPFAAVATAGALNVFLMRREEIKRGIDVYPIKPSSDPDGKGRVSSESLGKSKKAASIAVGETALSRVFNSTPIMVLPPLVLMRLQRQPWLASRPRMVLPVNLGLILGTSIFALPMALAVFPQRQRIKIEKLEEELSGKWQGEVEFNRGI